MYVFYHIFVIDHTMQCWVFTTTVLYTLGKSALWGSSSPATPKLAFFDITYGESVICIIISTHTLWLSMLVIILNAQFWSLLFYILNNFGTIIAMGMPPTMHIYRWLGLCRTQLMIYITIQKICSPINCTLQRSSSFYPWRLHMAYGSRTMAS